jgi:SAM-dependent methyltransferase
MEFTGERYVPGTEGLEELYVEHVSRYVFAGNLARGGKILDIGCGCGYGSHYLALCQADSVVGIDNSPEALRFAGTWYRHPNLRFALMDTHRLGLKAGFDLATCFEVIEHVDDAPALLREAWAALGDEGILLVSTPNRLTYVAGGEGGANPFHVREYDIREFTDLLGTVFSHVRVFGQHWVEGMALSPDPGHCAGQHVPTGRLPDQYGFKQVATRRDQSPYFFAACAKCDILDRVSEDLPPAVMHFLATRYEQLKRDMAKLEEEFDRRGRWAMGLERENHGKDETIEGLQAEMRDLKREFDQRGNWARSLNAQLRAQESVIRRLTNENAELKRLAGGARNKAAVAEEQTWTKSR